MTQRRRVATRPRAFSTDDVNEIQARRIDERKGAFGEVPEWDPTMFRGSKTKLMFNKAYYCTPEPLRSSIKLPTSCADWKSFFLIRVPIIQWLWSYQAKHLIGDLVAGLTIGMTHIPQGIGFALLAQLPVVHGLYASFVPVIIYSIFGTSRHISVGTFPVVALMVGTAVQRLSECSDMIVATNGTSDGDIINTTVTVCDNDPVDIAVTLAMMVGVLMIMASVLQLGFITLFLSDALVSSYTCAASFVIFTTQIRFLLGLDPSDSKVDPGLFDTPRKFIRYMDLLFHGGANAGAVVTSFLCILFLIVMDYVNMFIKKKFPHFPFPIPSQIILVIIATAISFCAKLSDAPIRLPVVDDIPTGAPPFTPPDFSLLSQLITDAITIMIVSYVINISQAKLLAKKHSYTLYPNQEFLAYGMMNFAGSLFGGFATAGALSRSILQDITGGCTQLVGLVSSVIVFIVILFLGTLFEPLPEATLATIIIVALKGLYLQVKDAKQSWVISKPDMLVWVVVFVCTLFIGLDIGLLIGVTFSMLQIIMFTILPHSPSLGVIDMWQLDKEIYEKKGNPVKGVFIFQFQAPLYFANISIFRQRLSLGTGIDPLVIKVDEQKEPGCFKACFHKIRYKEHVYNLEESVENGMRTVIDGTNNYVQTIQKYTTSSLPHTPQPFQEMSDISDLTITGGGTEALIHLHTSNTRRKSIIFPNFYLVRTRQELIDKVGYWVTLNLYLIDYEVSVKLIIINTIH
ncbi:prestin-like isoform X2 [Dysidea avara]|uniref:prestin-like isoform X2 n=1 Tax=Dysidea avara TaxID=196820 RepID=UPI00332ACF7C